MSVADTDNDALIAVYDRDARRFRTEWSAGAESATHSDKFINLHTPYLPPAGGHALDIGAGYGAHVHELESRGLKVVAVEPAAGMRAEAETLYPNSRATWLDDRLPDLAKVHALGRRFDFMLMNSVWMHLPQDLRSQGMASLATLLAPDGSFSVLLRHGPAPADRPMLESDTEPFLALAEAQGLSVIHREENGDELERDSVSFTRLILTKSG